MESIDKRYRIQNAAMQLFQEHGVDGTSVNEIVKKANVAKGTFYVYYKDKKELISQLLTKKHGCFMNEIMNSSYAHSIQEARRWTTTFVEDLITFYMEHPDVLHMIQRNIGVVMDTEAHRLLVLQEVQRLDDFLQLLAKEEETIQQALTKFLLIMEMTGFVCFNAMTYHLPDTMENVKPLLMNIVMKMCD